MSFFGDLFKGVTSSLTGNPFGVLSTIGNTLGSFFGAKNQNATQLNIARERNELDYQMWQEEKEHNIEMFNLENEANFDMWKMQNQAELDAWNMQNAYNDPSAQAERLLNAGINPYLYMSGQSGSAGNAGSGPGVGSLSAGSINPSTRPNPQGYTYQDPWLIAGSQMLHSVDSFSQAHLNDLVARGQDISNENASNLLLHDKQMRENALKRDDVETEFYREQKELELDILRSTKSGLALDNDTKEILNRYLPMEKQMSLMIDGQNLIKLGLENKRTTFQIYYDLVEHWYSVLQNEADLLNKAKDLDVKDSQIVANNASANASDSVANLNDETTRGIKATNDANEKWDTANSIAKAQMSQNEALFKKSGIDNDFYDWIKSFDEDATRRFFRDRYNHKTGENTNFGLSVGPFSLNVGTGYTSQPGY